MELNKRTNIILFCICLVIAMASCKKEKVEPSPDDPPGFSNVYIIAPELYIEHTKTVSPCPHNIGEVSVACAEDINDPCKVDSVVITNPHPSLLAGFVSSNGGTSAKLEPKKEDKILVAFNCTANESFTHIYKVNLYLKGQLVKTEEFEVTVVIL